VLAVLPLLPVVELEAQLTHAVAPNKLNEPEEQRRQERLPDVELDTYPALHLQSVADVLPAIHVVAFAAQLTHPDDPDTFL
jgi:hypothetical protein